VEQIPVSTIVATLGFAGGVVLGVTSRSMHFCTLGAIADAFVSHRYIRLRAWALAIAIAMLATQTMHMAGLIDIDRAIYLTPDFGWLGAALGGLVFGIGMALVGTCAYGSLIRLGGGDLRSLVSFLVLGVAAYMTLRGLTGMGRVLLIEPTNIDLKAVGGQGVVGIVAWAMGLDAEAVRPVVVAVAVVALLVYCFRDPEFRRSRTDILGGVIIGLVVAAGWFATGVAGADAFDPAPLESYSFVTPVAESLVYLMTYSGSTINFGIGAVGGVVVGSFLASWRLDELRLEAFDDEKEMTRHLLGAAMMGVGGVAALGCTIGQGISGMSTLSLGAPLALGSIFLGAYLGLWYLEEGTLRRMFRSGLARRGH
jgi:uncharacterized membrane protein YedE/YeeE